MVELRGYNYRTIPNFFDVEGVKLIPINFENDHKFGFYKWKFYKDPRKMDTDILMTTSDDIMPNVMVNYRNANVYRLTKHNGYTSWMITIEQNNEQ